MKILFVLENYYPHVGGVEVLFKNLTEGLVKKGHVIDVITHRMKGSKKYEIINGVNIHRTNCFHSRYWFTFFSIPKVIKIAKKYDLVHTTSFNGAFPAWFASKILHKKCIITIHEVWVNKWSEMTEMGKLNALIHNILEKLIYTLRFDMYVSVSKSTKNQLLDIGIKKEKISVVYNGVDYEQWNPKKYNRKKIRKELGLGKDFIYFFSGRPGTSKGLEYLIKAVPFISKKLPNSKLLAVVSKDRAYKKRYEYIINLVKKLGIQDKVMIHDPLSYQELPEYIKAVDCVVVPSLGEGFGFAAAEACAMGIAVVASNTTSLPEVVSRKFVLVNPKDPNSIADGVISVNKTYIKTTRLRKFELEDNINGYLNVYKRILGYDLA